MKHFTLLVIFVVYLTGCRNGHTSSDSSQIGNDQSIDEICELMEQSVHDDDNMERRQSAANERSLSGLLGKNFCQHTYPLSYAHAKLLVKGRRILPQLYVIAVDSRKSEGLHVLAWNNISILGGLDQPGILAKLLEENRSHKISTEELYWIILASLPIDNWLDVPPITQSGIVAWISKEVETKSYDQIALELLDEMMKPDRFYMTHANRFFRQMLNRLDDRDLDEWLSERSVAAYEFRQRELKKGYDPADRLAWYLGGFIDWDHELESAVKAIYNDPADQLACNELVKAISFAKHDLRPVNQGWEDRLRAWYKANRKFLIYDKSKHRFVVKPHETENGTGCAGKAGEVQ